MDIKTAAFAANMAKDRLEASGQIGRTENNSISWDGNTDGKIIIMGAMVRVSAKPFDLSPVETVTAYFPQTGTSVEADVKYLALIKNGPLSALVVDDETQPRVAVCIEEHYNEQYGTNIPVGVYFYNSETLRISAIKCSETIHPIDQKYLPGVCLPVVELPLEVMMEVQETGMVYNLPAGLVKSLVKAFESRTPLYLVCDAGEYAPYPGAYFSAIAYGTPYVLGENHVPSFEFVFSGIISRFFRGIDGTWILMMEV